MKKRDSHIVKNTGLTLPLTSLKGIGAQRARLFAQKNIHTILDLLFFTPVRYEDRTKIVPINILKQGDRALVKGTLVSGKEQRFYPSRKSLFKILIKDRQGSLELIWFNYRKQQLNAFVNPGQKLIAYGETSINRGHLQMIHPEIFIATDSEINDILGIYPMYSSVKGISPNMLRKTVRNPLKEYIAYIVDPVPEKITKALSLPDLRSAVKYVHFPPEKSSIERLNQSDTPFHRRLLFDRFFLVMITIAYRAKARAAKKGKIYSISPHFTESVKAMFPFALTSHQVQATKDIIKDLSNGRPMNRILMGDVGCGKTAVAAIAALLTVQNTMQAAIMAPTQFLARQHMDYFANLSKKAPFKPALLAGKLRAAEQRKIYNGIEKGEYNLIIGTQALLQEKLTFYKLGLVVIDEQHRFGVRERVLMEQKGDNPHLLVMTATPIPRTLAITIYGDMQISAIKQYPEGHVPVSTYIVRQKQKRGAFDLLKQKISLGHQAFVICPVIEGSEESDLKNAIEMAEKLRKIAPFRVGLVHGRMTPEEREKIMTDFRNGRIDLLVGTTVLEVGIHVPKATVMIIEQPERFGLAQLHQLRGRVGRGSKNGTCLLMVSDTLSDMALSRLKTLAETADGFKIAEKDFQLRRHGEITGLRQSGAGELDINEIAREPQLLSSAKREAENLINLDPELSHPENKTLKQLVESVLRGPTDL